MIADTIEDNFAARDAALMASAVVGGTVGAIPDATDPQTVTTRTTGGAVFPAVEWNGIIWSLDPDDTTTPHDEITCIRTIDGDGYFTDDVRFPESVISRTIDPIPSEDDSPAPQFGDSYLTTAGASGPGAGHDEERALFTARGWLFKAGTPGEIVLVDDEGATGEFIHVNKDSDWEDGLPGNIIDLSVRPSHLFIRFWDFENQTTTAPPATGPAAEQYVIGPSATGAWAGLDGKIAWRPSTDAAFEVTTPLVGERGYDKALGKWIQWSGSAWVAASDGLVLIETKIASASATIDFTTGLDDTYDSFEIRLNNIKPATDDVQLLFRIATGAGPTWQTGASYRHSMQVLDAGGVSNLASNSGTGIPLTFTGGGGTGFGNAAGENLSGSVNFDNPEVSDYVQFRIASGYSEAGGSQATMRGGGRYDAASAITGIRFYCSSGNIASGRFSLYGRRKS